MSSQGGCFNTNFKIKIVETGSFDKAQVCAGGVPLDEINLKQIFLIKWNKLYSFDI